jgi:lysyl-tRNA synthetase class 2
MMNHTENMLRYLAQTVLGSTKLHYGESVYDFSKSFVRMSMVDAILKYNPTMDEKVLRNPEANMEVLKDYARSVGVHVGPKEAHWGAGKLICVIFEETAEHKLDQPTFITEYPWEVSPLALLLPTDLSFLWVVVSWLTVSQS